MTNSTCNFDMDENEALRNRMLHIPLADSFIWNNLHQFSYSLGIEPITLVLLKKHGPRFYSLNNSSCAFVYLGVCHSAVKPLKTQLYKKKKKSGSVDNPFLWRKYLCKIKVKLTVSWKNVYKLFQITWLTFQLFTNTTITILNNRQILLIFLY